MLFLEAFVLFTAVIGLALAARQFVLAWCVLRSSSRSGNSSSRIVEDCDWPTVTVLIPAHNEECVIAGSLAAMTALDYPSGKLAILVVNDRSEDGTGRIAESFSRRDPRVSVLNRDSAARPGKAAAVADGMANSASDIIVLFDADYLPPPGLLKELVLPFDDPEFGATMGRVVPLNSDSNLLTKLLDLERRAGYAADQSGRALLGLVPQFGGTVGGIRRSALHSVGGWNVGHLAEDTDLTFRLVLGGWRVAYLNEARCHEEVPEDWASRFRQVRRWAYGHNRCLLDHFGAVLRSHHLSIRQKLDAVLILAFYAFPVLALLSTFAVIPLLAYGDGHVMSGGGWIVASLFGLAVIAPHVQVIIAARSDGQRHVLRVVPLLFVSSSLSLLASVAGTAFLIRDHLFGLSFGWDKTRRYRSL